jgi:hypothetical protein
MSDGEASRPVRAVSLRRVAIPSEHGGWGFTLEPVLLGLLVVPGWAGAGIGLAAVAAFLTRHPLKLWLNDVRRGVRYPRTTLAARVAFTYAAAGCFGLVLAAASAGVPDPQSAAVWTSFWWPLILAVPMIGIQLHFDARGQGRNLLPEIAGAGAMGSVAAAIALAGRVNPAVAYGLWLVLGMRAVASIFYARTMVMRARGIAAAPGQAYAAGVTATGVLAAAAALGLIPQLSVVAMVVLLIYAVVTLSRPPVPAKVVGWSQMALGLLVVLLTAIGTHAGL